VSVISVRGQFLNREVGADRFAAPAARLCRTYRQTLRERHVGWIPRYSPGKHAGNARHGDARESERERRWGLSLSLGTSLRSVIAEFRSTGCSFVRATVSTGLPPSTGSQQSAVNARLKSSDGRSLKSATIPYSIHARDTQFRVDLFADRGIGPWNTRYRKHDIERQLLAELSPTRRRIPISRMSCRHGPNVLINVTFTII